MEFGLIGGLPFITMSVLQTSSTDPGAIAAVEAFNMYFSLTFEFGVLAFMFTMVVSLLSRS